MTMDVAAFVRTVAAMHTPATAAAAMAALTVLRGDSTALALARAVLEAADVTAPAQLQAVLLFRDVAMRSWAELSQAECVALRDWALTLAANRWTVLARPVRDSLIAIVAIFWKRGWSDSSDESPMSPRLVVGQLEQLLRSGDGAHAHVAATLALALVTEFDASAGGRATALGLNHEFHRAAAASFANNALRDIFSLTARRLLAALTPACLSALATGTSSIEAAQHDTTLMAALLAVLAEVLLWDWSGRWGGAGASARGGSRSLVGTPGKAWRELLGDPACALPRALLALVAATRQQALLGDTVADSLYAPARGLLASLASCRPDLYANGGDYAAAATLILGGLATLLGDVSGGSSSGSVESRTAEAVEASEGINALLWAAGLPRLLESRVDLVAVLRAASCRAAAVLDELDGAAAAASRADASAVAAVIDFLDSAYASHYAALDAVLEVWSTVAFFLEDEDATGSSGGVADTALRQARVSLRADCAALAAPLYERLVRARLAMAAAVTRLAIDDDNALEDVSALDAHMTAAAALARLGARPALEALTNGVRGVHGRFLRLATLRDGNSATSSEVDFAVASEEAWWLVSYAGYVLADEAKGETPSVPRSLLALSANARSAGDDPVVALSHAVTAVLQYQTEQLVQEQGRAAAQHRAPAPHLSPLLTERLLWFAGRWVRTYLMPPRELFERVALPASLARAFGAGIHNSLPGGGDAPVTALGLAPLAVPMWTGAPPDGRAMLELVVSAAGTCLAAWGDAEPGVARAGVLTLRAVVNSETALRWATLSPAWSALAEAVLHAIRNGDNSGGLAMLPPEWQGALLAVLLAATRSIGYNGGAGGNEAWEALVDPCAEADPEPAAAAAGARALSVVARWRAYYGSFARALHERLASVLASHAVMVALAGAASHGGVTPATAARELDRLLAMHAGIVAANARIPDAWHFPATTVALAACAQVVDAARGSGPVATRCLRYMLEFLDADVAALEPAQARAVYASISNVFVAYARHRAVLPQQRDTSKAAADDTESTTVDDLVMLLAILDKVADKEDIDLALGGGDSAPSASNNASEAVMAGLHSLLPLVTPQLLNGYPPLGVAFVGLVGRLVAAHPLQIATRADARTFATFMGAIEWGLCGVATDTAVPSSALDAVRSLAAFHGACRRRGFPDASTQGLHPQLGPCPDVFARLTRAVLGAVVGAAPPDRSLVPAAGEALLALAQAEPDAFRGAISSLLAAQREPGSAARLTAEFQALMTANGVSMDVASRANKVTWIANFERFVEQVRSFTTIK